MRLGRRPHDFGAFGGAFRWIPDAHSPGSGFETINPFRAIGLASVEDDAMEFLIQACQSHADNFQTESLPSKPEA